jgi:hypothetical protein
MIEQPAIEHGSTSSSRWLRRNRIRFALAIAIVEALLLIVGAIDKWAALLVAVLVVVGYFALGSRLRSPVARDVAWVAAASQAIVALVPFLVLLIGTLTLIAVALLAVVALVVLFTDRR